MQPSTRLLALREGAPVVHVRELDPGASPLDFFGAELRRLREAAELTLKELGEKIYCTGSLIGQIETARKIPTLDWTERADAALGAGGLLVRVFKLVVRHEVPVQVPMYAGLEAKATHIYAFQPQLVHGLLQTEGYARAVLGLRTEECLAERVAQRLERQLSLHRENSPLTWVIFEESVLYQVVGGPGVMRKQLAHLLELAHLDWVKIQLLPFTAGAHAGLAGAFTIFRFENEPDLCYTENYDVGRANANPAAIKDRWLRYARLQAAALSIEDSAALIARVMEERYGEPN